MRTSQRERFLGSELPGYAREERGGGGDTGAAGFESPSDFGLFLMFRFSVETIPAGLESILDFRRLISNFKLGGMLSARLENMLFRFFDFFLQ